MDLKELLKSRGTKVGTGIVGGSGLIAIALSMMSQRPELFDQEGIVAKKAVGQFQQGDPLDNDLKVRQYAEAMMAETDAFFVRRLKKITDYILEE